MKKSILVVLIIATIMSLVSCGGNNEKKAFSEKEHKKTSVKIEEETKKETEEETKTETEKQTFEEEEVDTFYAGLGDKEYSEITFTDTCFTHPKVEYIHSYRNGSNIYNLLIFATEHKGKTYETQQIQVGSIHQRSDLTREEYIYNAIYDLTEEVGYFGSIATLKESVEIEINGFKGYYFVVEYYRYYKLEEDKKCYPREAYGYVFTDVPDCDEENELWTVTISGQVTDLAFEREEPRKYLGNITKDLKDKLNYMASTIRTYEYDREKPYDRSLQNDIIIKEDTRKTYDIKEQRRKIIEFVKRNEKEAKLKRQKNEKEKLEPEEETETKLSESALEQVKEIKEDGLEIETDKLKAEDGVLGTAISVSDIKSINGVNPHKWINDNFSSANEDDYYKYLVDRSFIKDVLKDKYHSFIIVFESDKNDYLTSKTKVIDNLLVTLMKTNKEMGDTISISFSENSDNVENISKNISDGIDLLDFSEEESEPKEFDCSLLLGKPQLLDVSGENSEEKTYKFEKNESDIETLNNLNFEFISNGYSLVSFVVTEQGINYIYENNFGGKAKSITLAYVKRSDVEYYLLITTNVEKNEIFNNSEYKIEDKL